MIGQLIGERYRVLRKLGEGGMAIVYLALDEKLGRNVAVKFLREKFQSHQEIRTRFQHEARAISSFDHPNILKVYDYSGAKSPQLWIVTELIHGRNLGQIVETAPGGWLHPVIAACIVRETCKALALAHSEGIVHRDVKPDNVMITQQGVIKLMDFGIAKIRQNNSMTQTGMFMGSPSYMSPEQVRGRDIDHRSDIYSLGVLFYELVTGRLPFVGQSTADVAMKILGGQFQHPKFLKEHLPTELNDLMVGMMALEPGHRPQSTDTVGGVIDKFLERNGFEASHAELDRCFRDPRSYGERLAKLVQQTVMVAMPTQVLSPNARMDAATRLPRSDQVARMVQTHNEAAIDRPIAHVPQVSAVGSATHLQKKPHPAHAIPPPPPRRDHIIPKNVVPHVTRKVSAPEQIIAHLPERRYQQRTEHVATTRAAAVVKQAAKVQKPVRAPKPPQLRPPRSLPRVPHRAPQPMHYLVHREVTLVRNSWSNWFFPLILLASAGILFSVASDKLHFGAPTAPVNVAKNTRVKPKVVPHKPSIAPVEKSAANIPKPLEIGKKGEPAPKPAVAQVDKPREKFEIPLGKPKIEKSKDRPQNSSIQPKPEGKPTALVNVVSNSNGKAQAAVANPIHPIQKPQTDDDATETTKVIPSSSFEKKEPTKPAESATEAKPQPKTGKATISISANPAAEIYINGRRAGTTNDAGLASEWMDVHSGRVKIELKREGFANRTEIVTVNPGEKRRFGPYNLNRENNRPGPAVYRLTLATNAPPAKVTIVNVESKATRSFNLTATSQTIQVERGVYEVTIEHEGEIRRRRIDLTGNTSQLTFNAEFKEVEN